jgi:hypothetical protein
MIYKNIKIIVEFIYYLFINKINIFFFNKEENKIFFLLVYIYFFN